MKRFFLLLVCLMSVAVSSQKIKVISKTTKKPLSNVLVFDKNGSLITKSDIDGAISKEALSKESYYLLSYENVITDTLKSSDLEKNEFYISDKIVDIEPIVLERKESVEEFYIKGYFVSYVLLNKKFNCYSDGIVTYKINKEDNSVGSEYVEQYRVFTLKDNSDLKWKNVASFDFKMLMKLPNLDTAANLKNYIESDKYSFAEKTGESEEINLTLKNIEDKETKFFGIIMDNVSREVYINYLSGASTENYPFNYLNKFSNTSGLNMKHKSEDNNNEIVLYTEFIPIQVAYSKPENEVNFSKNKSNYKESYWQNEYFPNVINLFNSFFKDDIEEQPNAHK